MPKQIGGVDLKWWLIGGGAVVGGVYFYMRRSSKTPATDTTATDQTGTPPDPYGYGGAYSPAIGVTPSLYDPVTGQYITAPTSGITTPTSVQGWTQQVVGLFGKQGLDTADLLSGLYNWLYGPNRLSQTEYAAVEKAIVLNGTPPGITTVPIQAPISQTTPSNLAAVKAHAYQIAGNFYTHGEAQEGEGAMYAANAINSSATVAVNRTRLQNIVTNYNSHNFPRKGRGASTVLNTVK
jgi:hypothetical protein